MLRWNEEKEASWWVISEKFVMVGFSKLEAWGLEECGFSSLMSWDWLEGFGARCLWTWKEYVLAACCEMGEGFAFWFSFLTSGCCLSHSPNPNAILLHTKPQSTVIRLSHDIPVLNDDFFCLSMSFQFPASFQFYLMMSFIRERQSIILSLKKAKIRST